MNTAAQIMGLDKLCGLYNVIKCNGGLMKLLRQLYRANDLKCGELIDEALNSSCCNTYPECSRLTKDTPEGNCSVDAMMSARLLKWLNYITKDCFMLVPANRLTSCDEDLQLSKLDLNLSPLQLIPPLNIWDCFSIVFPPQTIEMTELFTSESSNGESTHYYLAITKNNVEGSTVSDDVASHLSRANLISNIQFSSTASDAIYSSNDRFSLSEHLTNRNLSKQKPKISTESCTMRPCTTKTFSEAGILSGNGENLGSLRKMHIDCSSELEIECNGPSKRIRRRFGSKKGEKTSIIDVDKREKDKKLHIESKIAADLSKAMELPGEENTNVFMDHVGKHNGCNNMIIDSKETAVNKRVISCSSQEMDKLTKNPMLCTAGGKYSSGSDCTSEKSSDGQHSQHMSCKPGSHEGCGEKKPGCGKKHESGCGEKPPKKGGCGGESKKDDADEGTCHPNMHRKQHPCEKGHPKTHDEDPKASQRKAKSKEYFEGKMSLVRNKYKIDHCRRKKNVWGRYDFNKKVRNQPCDQLIEPSDICSEH